MSKDPQPSNKNQYDYLLKLDYNSSILDELTKKTMYMTDIKQVKSNDYTPGDSSYLKPYRSVSGKFLKDYQRVLEIDILSAPPISRNF
tara:strand:- start:26 stop:289 length:264 start_codon:yes stop_codon:yes gene_type:complete